MPMPGTKLGEEKRCSSGSTVWAWVLIRRRRCVDMLLNDCVLSGVFGIVDDSRVGLVLGIM